MIRQHSEYDHAAEAVTDEMSGIQSLLVNELSQQICVFIQGAAHRRVVKQQNGTVPSIPEDQYEAVYNGMCKQIAKAK